MSPGLMNDAADHVRRMNGQHEQEEQHEQTETTIVRKTD